MSQGISDEEVKAIRWVEWVLAPLVVISIMGAGKFAMTAEAQHAEMKAEIQQQSQSDTKIEKKVDEIHTEQRVIIQNQRNLEKEVTAIATHQEHFKDELQHLQNTSSEILRILREDD